MHRIVIALIVAGLIAVATAGAQWVKVYSAGHGASVAAPHFTPTPGPTSY